MDLDPASIAALLTALGTLIVVLNQRGKNKADAAASMTEAAASITEAAEKRIEQLTCRIEKQDKQICQLIQRVEKQDRRITELGQENVEFRHGIKLLIAQICNLGYKPVWEWNPPGKST